MTSKRCELRKYGLAWLLLVAGCQPKTEPIQEEQNPPEGSVRHGAAAVNRCGFIVKNPTPVSINVVGSGFFVRTAGADPATYYVTARHCVSALRETLERAKCLFLCIQKRDGTAACMQLPVDAATYPYWEHVNPAVDLAVFKLVWNEAASDVLDIRPFEITESGGEVLRKADFGDYVVVGTDVLIYGTVPELRNQIFGLDDSPLILTRGMVAALPHSHLQYENNRRVNLIAVDGTVSHGASGAAVVRMREDPQGNKLPVLVGVVSSFVQGRGIMAPDKRLLFRENTGVTLVIPTDYLFEILFDASKRQIAVL